MKRRHHYVPQFYLRAFASAPRRINIFNLVRGLPINNAGLRNQCFQLASEKLAAAVFPDEPPAGFVLDEGQSMALSLSTHRHVINALDDLKAHVIIASPGTQFVTSDNPAYHYNAYCEGITGTGTAGAASRGLQVFLPLSPQVTILLFDRAVYKAGRKGTAASSIATAEDVAAINLVQFAAAQDNVYFAAWDMSQQLSRLAEKAQSLRPASRIHLQKAYEVGNEQSMLLHQYEQTPNLDLRLSFLSLRRDARRVPLSERARQVRKHLPSMQGKPASTSEPDGSRARIFTTRRPK